MPKKTVSLKRLKSSKRFNKLMDKIISMKSVEAIYLIGGIVYRGWSKKDVDIWIVTNGNDDLEKDPIDKLKSFYKLDTKSGVEIVGFLFNGWVLDTWYGDREYIEGPSILLRGK